MPSAVTATLGRYPAWPEFGVGPSSVQLGLEVGLPKTPTSVATKTCAIDGCTTTAFAGESERFPVKSIQVVPAFVVFQTWPVPPVNPMTVTYAVFPLASDGSAAAYCGGHAPALSTAPPG